MAWSFNTEPEFQLELDWIDQFVRAEVEPLDLVLGAPHDIRAPGFEQLVRPLQAQVKARGLWACHLGPELGGKGFGQLKLALINELIGRSRFGPIVFGAQAPDSGNADVLAAYGTPEQKKRYLEPLLANEVVSCFALTEPQGGADPTMVDTTAVLDGDEWVLNGEKWFASNASFASFFLIMAKTDPDERPHRRSSMFIVPAETPGIEIIKDYGVSGQIPTHAHMRWSNVRIPRENLLGARGEGFIVAQERLGGGRMHHAMRTIALAQSAFEKMCERAVSRMTKGEHLARKQMVQAQVADSWAQLRQFRLLVLETAWLADNGHSWKDLRRNVAAVKFLMPQVLHDVASRALQIHGSLGLTDEMPFTSMLITSYHMGLADGPTEVHKVTVAREVLKELQPAEGMFPDYMRDGKIADAKAKFGSVLTRAI
ncbi:MAG: acyl-CoA dehydrogenase [Sphingomonadales bacterium BRH_c3]|nr:MAG: acyl-CoA dehydrogenase [Sphingomonadales bacterium BRH_c3]